MPRCRLLTSEKEDLKSFGQPVLPDRFPDEVVALEVDCISYYQASYHDISYENLANLMANTRKRLKKIEIYVKSDNSPEFLRFISVACEKTKSLKLYQFWSEPDLCDCLNSKLPECGIDEFDYKVLGLSHGDLDTVLPIFQGIARSSSLKKLRVSMQSYHVLGTYLIRALEENQTLESLCVELNPPWDMSENDNRMMQNIFCTTLQSTQVRELTLQHELRTEVEEEEEEEELEEGGAPQILSQQVFVDSLCHPTCVVEMIHLRGIKLQRESDSAESFEDLLGSLEESLVEVVQSVQALLGNAHGLGRGAGNEGVPAASGGISIERGIWAIRELKEIARDALKSMEATEVSQSSVPAGTTYEYNTSVKKLQLTHAALSSLQLRKILPRFKSLTELDLGFNNLWNVSPVMNMLLETDSLLGTICLEGNGIDEDDIGPFLTELPNMVSLRSLDLSRNPCVWIGKHLHNAGIAAVENAALRNTNIETLRYCHVEEEDASFAFLSGYDYAEIGEFKSRYDTKQIKAHLAINKGGRAYLKKGIGTLPLGIWPLILERASKLKYCGWNGSVTATDTRNDAIYWLLREKVFTGSS